MRIETFWEHLGVEWVLTVGRAHIRLLLYICFSPQRLPPPATDIHSRLDVIPWPRNQVHLFPDNRATSARNESENTINSPRHGHTRRDPELRTPRTKSKLGILHHTVHTVTVQLLVCLLTACTRCSAEPESTTTLRILTAKIAYLESISEPLPRISSWDCALPSQNFNCCNW
jgi:hypothetical protein